MTLHTLTLFPSAPADGSGSNSGDAHAVDNAQAFDSSDPAGHVGANIKGGDDAVAFYRFPLPAGLPSTLVVTKFRFSFYITSTATTPKTRFGLMQPTADGTWQAFGFSSFSPAYPTGGALPHPTVAPLNDAIVPGILTLNAFLVAPDGFTDNTTIPTPLAGRFSVWQGYTPAEVAAWGDAGGFEVGFGDQLLTAQLSVGEPAVGFISNGFQVELDQHYQTPMAESANAVNLWPRLEIEYEDNVLAPVITSPPGPSTADTSTLYTYTATADGSNLEWSLVEAPTGMVITKLGGDIYWMPSGNSRTVLVKIRVTDSVTLLFDEQEWTIDVTDTRTPGAVCADAEMDASVCGAAELSSTVEAEAELSQQVGADAAMQRSVSSEPMIEPPAKGKPDLSEC